ncbi:hypothetical protein EBR77_03645 [bacterium]|nr:hypothetical protein [bacterium]NBX78324.1 hypothetical protein [bacterium]
MKKVLLLGLLGLVNCEANAILDKVIIVTVPTIVLCVGAVLNERNKQHESAVEHLELCACDWRCASNWMEHCLQAADQFTALGMAGESRKARERLIARYQQNCVGCGNTECDLLAAQFDALGMEAEARNARETKAFIDWQACMNGWRGNCLRAADQFEVLGMEVEARNARAEYGERA